MTGRQIFKNAGLLGRPDIQWTSSVAANLNRVLESHCDNVWASPEIAKYIPVAHACGTDEVIENCDLAIVLGGDGSLLSVAWDLAQRQIPVAGINFGRLGFVAGISIQHIEKDLPAVLSGHGVRDERLLLRSYIDSGQIRPGAEQGQSALNEVLIHMPNIAHLGEFLVSVDGDLLYRIRADGMIVATPTGSTAYSLSAGGPILAPGLEGISIVPMLAHGPGSGSIVLPAESKITVQTSSQAHLTLDGRHISTVPAKAVVAIEQEQRRLSLLQPHSQDFFSRVRDKLGWGLSTATPPSAPH
ncbi:MAG: NAD(+)/NADH kinase [Gammaproteobacteria bacterium]